MRAIGPSAIFDEFRCADLGDERLTRRLGKIAEALSLNPSAGLPRAMRTDAALEATYRFMSNPNVSPERILEPHFEATCERARGNRPTLVVHDTTELAFNGDGRRERLGRTGSAKAGFFAHVALAVSSDDDRLPVGLLGLMPWARTNPATPRKKRRTSAYMTRPKKESNRWAELVAQVEDRVSGRAALIHVMDREADKYEVFDEIVRAESSFVIRVSHNRALVADERNARLLGDAVENASIALVREVPLSRRRRKYRRVYTNHPRDARLAHLAIAATSVEISRSPMNHPDVLPTLPVNVVNVFEVDPPEGEEAVDWMLLTNLPITTASEMEFVVDCYRARWIIEEFFKAIKTGCNYEKLQLESYHALLNTLAVMLPIAWQMLLLRSLARRQDDVPATRVLSASQVEVLRANPWVKVPHPLTARQALLAIASIGGHIKNNGEPGWLVLYRGFRDLLMLEAGWRARSDQS
jgi:hypothetical protein